MNKTTVNKVILIIAFICAICLFSIGIYDSLVKADIFNTKNNRVDNPFIVLQLGTCLTATVFIAYLIKWEWKTL